MSHSRRGEETRAEVQFHQPTCLLGKTLSKTTQLRSKGWELGGEKKMIGTAGERKINTI